MSPLKLKSKEYRIVKPRTYLTDHIWVPKFSLSQVTPEQPFVSLQQVASVCGQYEKKISLCLSRLGLDEVVHCGTVHFLMISHVQWLLRTGLYVKDK